MNITNMNINYAQFLSGKTVAVSGATGGIGRELCRYLASFGAKLILLDRNYEKSNNLILKLKNEFSNLFAEHITMDLENINSVEQAVKKLLKSDIDILILNAGAYHIPRHKCSTELDNVFQINFASPYYLVKRLLPRLAENDGRVVAVGSIAHNYSHINPLDIDFSNNKKSSKAYGNAKRFLMFSLYKLFEGKSGLAITHPGITFTNITAHYPKFVFTLIKHPMKIIFMKPKKAALSVLYGVIKDTSAGEWIGPRFFGIWGTPKISKLKTCSDSEAQQIFEIAEEIYNKCEKKISKEHLDSE